MKVPIIAQVDQCARAGDSREITGFFGIFVVSGEESRVNVMIAGETLGSMFRTLTARGEDRTWHRAMRAKIGIDDDVMIARRTITNAATHLADKNSMWQEKACRPIVIGSKVWIGSAAIISRRIRIGDLAVVGAGAVVTGHVPIGAVVAGNPVQF